MHLQVLSALFLTMILTGCSNESLVNRVESRIKPLLSPGVDLEFVKTGFDDAGFEYSITPREQCLRQQWGGLEERPSWWPESHWWDVDPITSRAGGPPCTDGPYLHSRVNLTTLNPLVDSSVHVYIRFSQEGKLIDYRLFTSHTGL